MSEFWGALSGCWQNSSSPVGTSTWDATKTYGGLTLGEDNLTVAGPAYPQVADDIIICGTQTFGECVGDTPGFGVAFTPAGLGFTIMIGLLTYDPDWNVGINGIGQVANVGWLNFSDPTSTSGIIFYSNLSIGLDDPEELDVQNFGYSYYGYTPNPPDIPLWPEYYPNDPLRPCPITLRSGGTLAMEYVRATKTVKYYVQGVLAKETAILSAPLPGTVRPAMYILNGTATADFSNWA